MADIREHYEGQGNNEFLRATSSQRASDLLVAQIGKEAVAANIAANNAKKYGVAIFGRLHPQRWDDENIAQQYADKMGGKLVVCEEFLK